MVMGHVQRPRAVTRLSTRARSETPNSVRIDRKVDGGRQCLATEAAWLTTLFSRMLGKARGTVYAPPAAARAPEQ